MSKNVFDVGDLVRCSAVFNDGAADVDPSTVTFKVKTPSGAVTTYVYNTDVQLVKDSTGNYHVDVSATAPGEWAVRYSSTGTGQAAGERRFRVQPSLF